MQNHWDNDPLDIAIVNHMVIEDIYLVDKEQNSFKLHCATNMRPEEMDKRCRDDAKALGVELCHFDDLENKLPDMDIVVCHFPQTHELLFAEERANAKRIFFVHAIENLEVLQSFGSRLARSDYVYCISERIHETYRPYFKRACFSGVYIPSCPLESIPEERVLEEAPHSNADRKSEILTYCSGLSMNPDEDYKINDMKDGMVNMETALSWKIVTSTDDVKQKIDKHEVEGRDDQVTIKCHKRVTYSDFNMEDIFEATSWAIPTTDERRISRLDLVFAVGSGKPVLTNGNDDEIMEELKGFMNVTQEDNITFGSVSQPLNHAELQDHAKKLLWLYLFDTKSAESHKELLENLIGK